MPIAQILTFCPQAKSVLAEYGLHCFHCAGSQFEILEEGVALHGYSSEEIDELVDDLNTMLSELPARPQHLTVTAAAAKAIRGVAETESQTGQGLEVIADASGGFCMEFRADPADGSKTFTCPDESDVRVFATPMTLSCIGGATIDFRDGRFKLDMPADEASEAACGCSDGACSCQKNGSERQMSPDNGE